jgi:hypothetical protein
VSCCFVRVSGRFCIGRLCVSWLLLRWFFDGGCGWLCCCFGGFVGVKSDGSSGLRVVWLGFSKLFVLYAFCEFIYM